MEEGRDDVEWMPRPASREGSNEGDGDGDGFKKTPPDRDLPQDGDGQKAGKSQAPD